MDTENPGVHQRRSGLARVAVTGAAGFLGGWIARQLRAQKIEVMALGADHLEMESQILAPLFENFAPTTIVHAAGPASVNFSMARPLIDFRRSVAGVYEVLEAARLECPDALVLFLSSAAVYGDPETLPVAETAPARPVSPYGFHKLSSELALREYHEIYGLRSVSLRIFSATERDYDGSYCGTSAKRLCAAISSCKGMARRRAISSMHAVWLMP